MEMTKRSAPSVLQKERSKLEQAALDSMEKVSTSVTTAIPGIINEKFITVEEGTLIVSDFATLYPQGNGTWATQAIDHSPWVDSIKEVVIQKRQMPEGLKWVVMSYATKLPHPTFDTFIEASIEMARILDPETYDELQEAKV